MILTPQRNIQLCKCAITGHKSRSVFDRYNIVNENDLKMAAKRQEAYLAEQQNFATGTVLGTVAKIQRKKG